LAFVELVLKTRRWNIAELARVTGIHPTTFSKFMNDPENRSRLQPAKIGAIEQASGMSYRDFGQVRGFEEAESDLYDITNAPDALRMAISGYKRDRNGVDAWVLNSSSLELAGYIPGDILIVDLNAQPRNGDIVCAQVYRQTQAETVFRILEEDFLISATVDRTKFKPLRLDSATNNVIVRGVVIASLRERRAA
jgi:1,2-phenylacetyl-CoA epoxidase PaaB subunit